MERRPKAQTPVASLTRRCGLAPSPAPRPVHTGPAAEGYPCPALRARIVRRWHRAAGGVEAAPYTWSLSGPLNIEGDHERVIRSEDHGATGATVRTARARSTRS